MKFRIEPHRDGVLAPFPVCHLCDEPIRGEGWAAFRPVDQGRAFTEPVALHGWREQCLRRWERRSQERTWTIALGDFLAQARHNATHGGEA